MSCTYHNGDTSGPVALNEVVVNAVRDARVFGRGSAKVDGGTLTVTGIDKDAGTIQLTSTATFPAHFGSSHVLPHRAKDVLSVTVLPGPGWGSPFELSRTGAASVPGVTYDVSDATNGVSLRCNGEIPDGWRRGNVRIEVKYTVKSEPVEPKCGPRVLSDLNATPGSPISVGDDVYAQSNDMQHVGTFASTDRIDSWKPTMLGSDGYLAEVRKIVDSLKTTSANEILKKAFPQDKLSDGSWLMTAPPFFGIDRNPDHVFMSPKYLDSYKSSMDIALKDLERQNAHSLFGVEKTTDAPRLAGFRVVSDKSPEMVHKQPEVMTFEAMGPHYKYLRPTESLAGWLFDTGHRDNLVLARADYRQLMFDAGSEWGGHRFKLEAGGVNFAGPEGRCFIKPAPREAA